MKKVFTFFSRFVDAKLDLRVRLFNVVAMAGTLISTIIGISCIFTNAGWANMAVNFATAVLAFSLLMFAYLRPEALTYFPTEQDIMADIIIAFVTVSVAVGLTIYFQLRLYNDQQKIPAEQNAALDRLNQLKTEFLSNVSHELKTPLTVMSVIAQQSKSGLSEYPELAEMAEQMRVIAAESDRLGLMVTQVLDMTRIEEGRMVITPRPCNISEIIQTTMSTYYPLLKKNGNRPVLTPCDDLPDVYADPDRVSQVLVNLL